jgi:hypothetical protein
MAFNWQKIFHPITVIGLIGLSSVTIEQPAKAALINGSFEGSGGWTTGGVTSIQTASFGITPTDSINQLLITNAAGSPPTGIDGLEDFLNVPIGIVNDSMLGTSEQGSAVFQDFSAQSGDTIFFDWNFLTNDTINDDYGFAIFAQTNQLNSLIHDNLSQIFRVNPNLMPSNSPFDEESGYQTVSLPVTTSGTYRLAFGVIDVNSRDGLSGIVVDNVRQITPSSPIPESRPLWGLVCTSLLFVASCIRSKQ